MTIPSAGYLGAPSRGLPPEGLIADEIDRAVVRVGLDLSGRTIVTEAGTGAFLLTPLLALRAGAKRVLAVVRTSRHGRAEEIARSLDGLARRLTDASRLRIEGRAPGSWEEADIVTNLGHVRPLDRDAIAHLRRAECRIALMCEAWEARPGDVDPVACAEREIAVWAVDEHHPVVDCFHGVGSIALLLALESSVPLRGRRALVISNDPFGESLRTALTQAGASVVIASPDEDLRAVLADAEVVVTGAYAHARPIRLDGAGRGRYLIQVAGEVEVDSLIREGWSIHPFRQLERHRMARTLADVGIDLVLRLHAAGLAAAADPKVPYAVRFR